VTEYILGVQADFDGLKVSPCLPSSWETATMERTFRNAKYVIQIRRGDKQAMLVDGIEMNGNKVPAFSEGTTHQVEIWINA
jgi:cellobiose phosphorylase